MASLDPRNLRPSETVRLLNSTPLGAVIDTRRLRAQRSEAGYRVGQGQRVDLFRYLGWLFDNRHRPPAEDHPGEKPSAADRNDYDSIKAASAARNKALSTAGRDIGAIRPVEDPDRREACRLDFRLFCDTYFPLAFYLEWSDDHLKIIAKLEEAVLQGGLFALAMPRSSGKTTICECACLWAVLYGHRRFVLAIGSEQTSAEEMLDIARTSVGRRKKSSCPRFTAAPPRGRSSNAPV